MNLAVLKGENRQSYGLRLAVELVQRARAIGGRSTWVYFIQEDCGDGAIKVGIAGDPTSRVASLQTGNSNELVLRAVFFAPAALERVIHDAFADDRLEGEWFAGTESLEALADAFASLNAERTQLKDASPTIGKAF